MKTLFWNLGYLRLLGRYDVYKQIIHCFVLVQRFIVVNEQSTCDGLVARYTIISSTCRLVPLMPKQMV